MLKKRRIPILFCIDIEPDERKIERDSPTDWVGFEKTFDFFQELRPRFATTTREHVHFSWFLRMDPQVALTYGSPEWVVTRYGPLFRKLEGAGDELGLHAHAWRWEEQTNDWIADFEDPEWIDHCIRSGFDAFQRSLHRKCRSFRFGDHWMDQRSLDLIEQLGARFDLTLEPGQAVPTLLPDERFTGSFPDCRRMPQQPYRPERNNFTKPGRPRNSNLWLVPVGADLPSPQPATPQLPATGRENENYVTLNLAFSKEVFSNITERLLSRFEFPFLVVVARSNITIVQEERTNLLANMEYLLSHPLAERFICETPPEAIKRLSFSPLGWLGRLV